VLPAVVFQYHLDALFGFTVIGAVKINGALELWAKVGDGLRG
jgi:hypothetical protein